MVLEQWLRVNKGLDPAECCWDSTPVYRTFKNAGWYPHVDVSAPVRITVIARNKPNNLGNDSVCARFDYACTPGSSAYALEFSEAVKPETREFVRQELARLL